MEAPGQLKGAFGLVAESLAERCGGAPADDAKDRTAESASQHLRHSLPASSFDRRPGNRSTAWANASAPLESCIQQHYHRCLAEDFVSMVDDFISVDA